MIIKILLFLIFTFSIQSFSDENFTHYYHHENYNFRISSSEYTRFIKPQIRNILIEIPYNLKDILNKQQKEVVTIVNDIFKVKTELDFQRLSIKNYDNLNSIKKSCRKLVKLHMQFLKNNNISTFKIIKSFKKINLSCFRMNNLISNLNTSTDILLNLKNNQLKQVPLMLSNLHIESIDLLINFFPIKIQYDIQNLLTQFFFPLYRIYLKDNNLAIKTFISQIDNLNNSFSVYQMEMEKKDTQYLPEGHIKKLKILLNRWNSIFKVILRKK